jgi:hypothetical protein
VNAMLAVSTIKGGIRVGGRKGGNVMPAASGSTSLDSEEREPVLTGPAK